MKKFLIGFICAISLFAFNVKAEEITEKEKVSVYVFTKDGCPYCEKAKSFLESSKKKYGKYYEIVEYQVYDSDWNANEDIKIIMDQVAEKRGDEVEGVPYIVIGDNYSINGYTTEYNDAIISAIKEAYNDKDYKDLVVEAQKENQKALEAKENEKSYDGLITAGILVLTIGGIIVFICLARKKNK